MSHGRHMQTQGGGRQTGEGGEERGREREREREKLHVCACDCVPERVHPRVRARVFREPLYSFSV